MKKDVVIVAIIIAAFSWATWKTVVVAATPREVKPPACVGEFGHERPPWWCARRDGDE